MPYVEHTWTNGETITAAKMNNIEEGIAEAAQSGGSGAVIIIDDGTALDKTYAEIYDLIHSGTPCYIKYNIGGSTSDLDTDYAYAVYLVQVIAVYKYNDSYRIWASSAEQIGISGSSYIGSAGIWTYQASTSSDYPTFFKRVYTPSGNISSSSVR